MKVDNGDRWAFLSFLLSRGGEKRVYRQTSTVVSVSPVKLWLKVWHPKFNKFFFPQCHLVQILDGTLVANACVEFRFKERLPCFVCMLDMEKHLVCLIEGFSYMFWMGFGASLCGWIRNVCNLQLSQC